MISHIIDNMKLCYGSMNGKNPDLILCRDVDIFLPLWHWQGLFKYKQACLRSILFHAIVPQAVVLVLSYRQQAQVPFSSHLELFVDIQTPLNSIIKFPYVVKTCQKNMPGGFTFMYTLYFSERSVFLTYSYCQDPDAEDASNIMRVISIKVVLHQKVIFHAERV